jgi:hypothetical protein
MGLFDIGIRKELSSKKTKKEILNSIQKGIEKKSEETSKLENDTLILNNFKTSILKYDLCISLKKSPKGFNISIDGELQQLFVLILLALIILSIIVTKGIGVAVLVAFSFLQKHYASKYINSLIEDIS